jgi:hypothetical protein
MLLDLRVLLSASLAAVLLLIGGFGGIALLRPPAKPSTAIAAGSEEITGAIGKRGDKSQSLTDADKAAEPAQRAAEPVRAADLDKSDKAEKTDKTPAAPPASADAAKAKPRAHVATRPEPGANFRANNPFAFPFGVTAIGGTGGTAGQQDYR